MEASDVCDLANDRLHFWQAFSILNYTFVALSWHLRNLSRGMLLVMGDSKKQRTYDLLWVRFLACVDLYLHIKAAVTSIWVKQEIFTNRGVNEGKVRTTVVNDSQCGSRRSASMTRFGDLGAIYLCGGLPLHPNGYVGESVLVFAVDLVVIAVVAIAVLNIPNDFSREVDLRIGSDTLTISIQPRSVYMASVVVVHERGPLVFVCRYVFEKRKLKE